MNRTSCRLAFAAVAALLALDGSSLTAQSTFEACRVPSVGAIYMINVPGAPAACLDASHVAFSWTEGGVPAAGSITDVELAADAVTSAKILDASILPADMQDGAVTNAKLAPGMFQWAIVTSAGSVFGSSGGITGTRTATGIFELAFTETLGSQSNCAHIATAAEGAHILQTVHGARYGGGNNALRVLVFDAVGVAVNGGFGVVIMCT
ncbi:MAG: hypothetical protein OEO79_02075 [Gemmatimonadota bacterium]|nr:hypothetical protein [Gemmatimonadota bacterium]